MGKFESRQIENKEKFGENIEMVIDLIRHAEKEGLEGGLTEKGKEESRDYGNKLKQEFPESAGVKVYHSDVERAKQTGELIKQDSKFKERERLSLSLVGKISKEFGDKLVGLVDKETGSENGAIQAIIDTGVKRPDIETKSSKELSKEMADQLLILIKMSERFKENSKLNIALISHSGMIENFLVGILNKERKNFLEEIGGPLKFLEGVRLIVRRQDKENVAIKLKFRDYEIDINKENLENIDK